MGRFLLVVALCSLTGCATDGGVTSHSGPPSSPVSEVLQFTPFADTANNPSFGTRVTDSADNTLTVTIRFVDGEPWLVLDATNATGETATLTLDPASLNQETSPDRDLFAEAGMVLDGTPLQAAFNGDDVVEPLSSALDEATALFADQLAGLPLVDGAAVPPPTACNDVLYQTCGKGGWLCVYGAVKSLALADPTYIFQYCGSYAWACLRAFYQAWCSCYGC